MARLKAPTSIGGVPIDPSGPELGDALRWDGTAFVPAPAGSGNGEGSPHVVDPVEPVDPADGLLWTNPDEVGESFDFNTIPMGVLGHAQVVANQAGITTEVDLTGLSVTVNVPAGRRIKITPYARLTATVATDRFIIDIKEGATYIGLAGDFVVGTVAVPVYCAAAVLTPSAGVHTYRLTARRISGTGSATLTTAVTSPCYIMVEDIGVA